MFDELIHEYETICRDIGVLQKRKEEVRETLRRMCGTTGTVQTGTYTPLPTPEAEAPAGEEVDLLET